MRTLFVGIMLLFGIGLFAQTETTLPALMRLNQASYLNPAIVPTYKYSLGIPALSGFGIQTGIAGLNLADVTKNLDDSGRVDLSKVHEQIKGNALRLNVYTNVELFHFRFKVKEWYFGVHANSRVISNTAISKDLLGLIVHGNAYFTGKIADFSDTKLTNVAFNEYGISLAKTYNRFNFGLRVKMYQGLSTAFSDNLRFNLTTPVNPTDSIRVQLAGNMRTAGVGYLGNTLDGREATDQEKRIDNTIGFQNRGSGIDLGVTYDVSNKLTIGASITDLGAHIKWRNQTYNYAFDNIDLNFTGFNYAQVQYDSSRKEYLDSLGDLFKSKGTNQQFTTNIPTRYFLNANYQVNKKNSIGLMLQGQYGLGQNLSAFTLSYARRFGKRFDVTTNYSRQTNKINTLGLGLALKTSVFQIYMVHDNVLFYFNPSSTVFFNFRFGINFVWGEIKRPVKVY
jgi:hypothetical protein